VVIIKKVKRRVPGGRISTHLRKENPKIVKCAVCKKPLHGIPRLIPSKLKKLSKSKKKVFRIYGGYLCSGCSRELLRKKVRNMR